MKKVLISVIFITLWVSLFSQLSVESSLNKNTLISQLGTGDDNLDPGLEDLFFSISPNGIPQYGRKVEWNLWANTDDEARYYRVKKGSWGLTGINDSIVPKRYNDEVVYSPSNTPDIGMGKSWVKLSKSWNFSRGAYNIVVLSVKNQGKRIMEEASVQFSYPISDLSMSEVKIYNNWAVIERVASGFEHKTYTLGLSDLLPGETRHLYFYIFATEKNKRELDEGLLSAELLGHEETFLTINKTNPPHDPNSLTLVNALVNTPPIRDCAPFSGHPVLGELCENGVPFWYDNQGYDVYTDCKSPTRNYCDLHYSLNYPYCNIDQEKLIYQMTCLNDGLGTAGKVIMRTYFDEDDALISESFTTDESSHDVQSTWMYPRANFTFDEINLPGLNDPDVVYMYNECSAQVTFSLDTKCGASEDILAGGVIEFFDLEGDLADDLETNTVTTVPGQGLYDNIKPNCIACPEKRLNPAGQNTAEKYILSTDEGRNYITIARLDEGAYNAVDETTTIRIVGVSGQVIKQLSVPTFQLLSPGYRIEVSDLSAGIYILTGEDSKSRFAKKFIH